MDRDLDLIAHGGPGDSNGNLDPRRIAILELDPKAEAGLAIVIPGVKDRSPVAGYKFGNRSSRALKKEFKVHCRSQELVLGRA